MLGDEPYTNPADDEAPWYDPDEPASGEFFGFYPLSIGGLEGSSRASAVTESTSDGGVPGRVRHATKAVVFAGALLAATERGAEYGMRWLRRATLGAVCSRDLITEHALGSEMRFLAYDPTYTPVEAPEAALVPLVRLLRRVAVNNGPTVLAKRALTCGGAVWQVSFTAVAGIPFEFGLPKAIIQGYMDPTVTDPWVPGITPGTHDTVSTAFEEVDCGQDLYEPIYDPLCPALLVPPPPPSVPLGCFVVPTDWDRRAISVPAELVPLWGEVAPVVTVNAPLAGDVRNARIRFYEDPNGDFNPDEDPCAFLADMVVSYVPAGASLTVDAATQEVYVITSIGERRRADSLVFGTDSAPFEWPYLSCGFAYVLTIDMPDGATVIPSVDLSLVSRMR
jgi:hypothetical protein